MPLAADKRPALAASRSREIGSEFLLSVSRRARRCDTPTIFSHRGLGRGSSPHDACVRRARQVFKAEVRLHHRQGCPCHFPSISKFLSAIPFTLDLEIKGASIRELLCRAESKDNVDPSSPSKI